MIGADAMNEPKAEAAAGGPGIAKAYDEYWLLAPGGSEIIHVSPSGGPSVTFTKPGRYQVVLPGVKTVDTVIVVPDRLVGVPISDISALSFEPATSKPCPVTGWTKDRPTEPGRYWVWSENDGYRHRSGEAVEATAILVQPDGEGLIFWDVTWSRYEPADYGCEHWMPRDAPPLLPNVPCSSCGKLERPEEEHGLTGPSPRPPEVTRAVEDAKKILATLDIDDPPEERS